MQSMSTDCIWAENLPTDDIPASEAVGEYVLSSDGYAYLCVRVHDNFCYDSDGDEITDTWRVDVRF